jgi:hypothetical protein
MTVASDIRLGPYEMVSAIGAGGMSEMYRPLGFEERSCMENGAHHATDA